MKVKVLAVAEETKIRKVGREGREIVEREIFLGFERDGFKGYAPKVRAGLTKVGNRPYGIASVGVDVTILNGYVPQPNDMVNVEYNDNGHIVSFTKA